LLLLLTDIDLSKSVSSVKTILLLGKITTEVTNSKEYYDFASSALLRLKDDKYLAPPDFFFFA